MSVGGKRHKDSLGYVRGYGRSRGSGYGYVTGGSMRLSSRRRMPRFLPYVLAIVGIVALVIVLVAGSAWLNYARFTRAARALDAPSVAAAYTAGTNAPIPGSSPIFWWLVTRYVDSEFSRAANAEAVDQAIEAFADTFTDAGDLVTEIVIPKAITAVDQYRNKVLEERVAGAYLGIAVRMRPQFADLISAQETYDILVASRAAFAAAKKAAQQPYGSEEAAELFGLVAEIDEENYAIAQAEIPELKRKANEEMTTWTAPVKHFTLNPLLAFPAMAPWDYSNDFITAVEFKRVLKQLFDNDYVLVGLETLFTVDDKGAVTPTQLRVPKEKKPLVLSIENLSYATRHEGRGMVDRLVVSEDRIATFTYAEHAGTDSDVISWDNDVIPILEQFIEDNPTFSWRGARATISLAGYSGTFGYRTAYGNEDQQAQIASAQEIADLLDEKGYTFASLGFEYLEMSTLEPEQIAFDAQSWIDQTGNIVGTTPLFFWPFGDVLPQDSEGAALLRGLGYRSFTQIGPNSFEEFTGKARIDERAFIDGNGLYNWPERYEGYFDAGAVIDTEGRDLMSYWLEWY